MEPEVSHLANGSRFEGRYEILGVLGSGSFGRVYEARQLSTGKSVAIKLLSPRRGPEASMGHEAERFRRETQIGATLSHPNIVGLMDAGEAAEGRLYAVFAYVPGETIKQALEREGALGVRESIRVMTQVLEALACAHSRGIVHRDLKPSNLMLSGSAPRRNAVVLDFGVGGLAEDRRRAEWQTLTQAREFVGTPLYAAPEQLAGEVPTPRSDFYSWGLVFLECLTGRQPFAEAGGMERLLSGGGSVVIPEWLRGHRLGALLETVTAREPAKRDVSVESLIEALDAIAGGELPVAPEQKPTPASLPGKGERRHLTVMFCDLVGSTALSQQLEGETYREVMRAYQTRVVEAVERYEGHVVQYLGDGLLVYFGYPQAHEEDAERAIRAGRELLRSLDVLSAQTLAQHGVSIAARVGIHAGPVVVGEMGRGEKTEILAVGDTPNIAARLAGFAEPGTVVISEATRRLVPGLFVTEDRGTPELKGVAVPFRVHRVLRPSGVRSRLERATGLTPFVGREEELRLLVHRFEQAQEGQGQAVLVGGEAGIGKSRLVRELRGRLRDTPHSWLECQTSPYTQDSTLYPLIAMLEGALAFREKDAGEEKLARLERGLAYAGLELTETVPLFASLLSLRLAEGYTPLEISPQLQRQKTLEALLAWLLALSEKQPLVLVVEDLHWIDSSTLEWLGLAIGQCPTTNLLLLLTHRPEFKSPWPSRGHVLSLGLDRIGRSDAKGLVARVTADAKLPESIVAQIAGRSDGVPLFVEELAKGVVELGHSDARKIPETLQDSLMARLDRLGDAKPVAQHAAAIGREFDCALLAAVAPLKAPDLREGLERLVEAELVYQRGVPPKASYTFKHALVQETAYQSLLESQRRELHGRIADALEQRFPERGDRHIEEIARHNEEAGRTEQAIGSHQQAASRAMQTFGAAEAISHLERALELLHTLPENRNRNQQELQLQLALTAPLGAAKGYAHPEVERVHARARELCQAADDAPELFRAVLGLAAFYTVRGRLRTATDLGEQALHLAERVDAVPDLLVAHDWLGITLQLRGEFALSLKHHEEASRLYEPSKHRSLAYVWGHDPGIHARCFAASTSAYLGHPDRARRMSRETVELARQGDPYSLAIALAYSADLYRLLHDRARVPEAADEAIELARERGFPYPLALASFSRGWSIGGSQWLGEVQRAVAWFQGVGWVTPAIYQPLAEAHRCLGRTEDALAALETALALSEENDSRYLDAALHRLRGEVFLQRDEVQEAERCFRQALEIAQEQSTKLFELRAAASLARLLRDRGGRDEARALLQPAYDWFTEGFDTTDLKDAKELLGQLN